MYVYPEPWNYGSNFVTWRILCISLNRSNYLPWEHIILTWTKYVKQMASDFCWPIFLHIGPEVVSLDSFMLKLGSTRNHWSLPSFGIRDVDTPAESRCVCQLVTKRHVQQARVWKVGHQHASPRTPIENAYASVLYWPSDNIPPSTLKQLRHALSRSPHRAPFGFSESHRPSASIRGGKSSE